ncbi:MAG: hypothetical protein R3C20_01970 [Planctomycetaceae bacterium]
MGSLFRALMNLPLFQSMLRPVTRVVVGLIAIPFFRFVMRRVFRLQDLNDELEKDLEQWFRGALLLLAATANMEHLLFGWMSNVDWLDKADWLTMGLRLMLAIGVIEAMPDQEIFAVIHPGPPKLKPGRNVFKEIWEKKRAIVKGVICRHMNRSSPVLAMMCAIVGSNLPASMDSNQAMIDRSQLISWSIAHQATGSVPADSIMAIDTISHIMPDARKASNEFERHWERWLVGWTCYLLAITQYLIIGLVTSKDRAMDVLSEFDRAVAQRREELIEEFQLQDKLTSPTEQVTGASPKPDDDIEDAGATAGGNAPTDAKEERPEKGDEAANI